MDFPAAQFPPQYNAHFSWAETRGEVEDQRSVVFTPAAVKCPNMSVDLHPLFIFLLLPNVSFKSKKKVSNEKMWFTLHYLSPSDRGTITRNLCRFSIPVRHSSTARTLGLFYGGGGFGGSFCSRDTHTHTHTKGPFTWTFAGPNQVPAPG